jgi:RNA polymerase-binding transcription factor DksA
MAKKKHPAPASKKSAPTKKPPAKKKPAPSPSKSVKPAPKKPSKPAPAPAPKPNKAVKAEKANKPVKAEKANKQVKAEKANQPVKAEKAAKPAAPAAEAKGSARELLRSRILGKAKTSKPIAFSLDEVREIAKTVTDKGEKSDPIKPTKSKTAAKIDLSIKNAKQNHVKAASLADVLGFNPRKARPVDPDADSIPEKFRRYYKLLIELRNHLTGQLDQHTEDTLKRSSKEDSGDLSSYGQHMADAGTDTFDRDFALSLVSNEQEALSEVEAAIQRIKAGTYGVCEITQKPIAKERLLAVPFTRHSAEAQKALERNRHRSRTQAGLFGELGEDGPKAGDDGNDE